MFPLNIYSRCCCCCCLSVCMWRILLTFLNDVTATITTKNISKWKKKKTVIHFFLNKYTYEYARKTRISWILATFFSLVVYLLLFDFFAWWYFVICFYSKLMLFWVTGNKNEVALGQVCIRFAWKIHAIFPIIILVSSMSILMVLSISSMDQDIIFLIFITFGNIVLYFFFFFFFFRMSIESSKYTRTCYMVIQFVMWIWWVVAGPKSFLTHKPAQATE